MSDEKALTMPSVSGDSKVIQILDPQAGTIKETVVAHGAGQNSNTPLQLGQYTSLKEAATTAQFPSLLRDGLKAILFDSYNMEAVTFTQLVFQEGSNKPAEDWLEMNTPGILPQVGEGDPYPELEVTMDRAVRIANFKRGYRFGITEELTRFDRVNMIKQIPAFLGTAARMTQEQAVYSALTTAGNYVRNSTTGDNDIGANTAATTFSAAGLNLAYATLRTMRDRKSGVPLGIIPDTLIVTPQLEMAAKALVLSPNLQIPGDGVATAKIYGTGTSNPFRGMITKLIVTPFVGSSNQWVLGQAGKGLVYQEVDPLQLLQYGSPDMAQLSPGYFVYDRIEYRVRIWFGTGFTNDRYWYYSSATAAPAVG